MTKAIVSGVPKVLMASYGGGHAAMIAPVASHLRAQGVDVDLIGFTTAKAYFERAGLACASVSTLLDGSNEEDVYREIVRDQIVLGSHPDIEIEDAEAYFTLGLRALAEDLGLPSALERVRAMGRKAFMPVTVFSRYISRTRPDVVVSTTSPRFELALLRAARREGVPSLALGDLFLIDEREWILSGEFSAHLTVISSTVADALRTDGLIGTEVHVTGNPAFDSLAGAAVDRRRRLELRTRLGLADKTIILWPMAGEPGAAAADGRPYALAEQVVAAMEEICRRDSSFAYIIRPHPNALIEMPSTSTNGILDAGLLSPEEALIVCDVVAVEVSTMGLQAALIGKPVVCVGFAREAGFPEHGLATPVDDLHQAVDLISTRRFVQPPSGWSMPPLGEATQRVANLILELAATAS